MNLSFDTYAHLASIKNAKLRTLVTEEAMREDWSMEETKTKIREMEILQDWSDSGYPEGGPTS